MDRRTGGINKIHEPSFFGEFEREYIKDLTRIDLEKKPKYLNEKDFRQILKIQLKTENKENVINVIRQLEKIDGIIYAGPNYPMRLDEVIPDDEYFDLQKGLYGPGSIQAPDAWQYVSDYGSTYTTRVGIIDTGIAKHSDLTANLVPGWNVSSDNNDTSDNDSHGTHVSGIAGSVANNSMGIAGICWNIELVPIKATGGAKPTIDKFISAITYAINNGIDILNYSMGIYTNNSNDSFAIYSAILNYTGLFVTSAGNDSIDLDDPANHNNPLYAIYPQVFDLPNMITVGATTYDEVLQVERIAVHPDTGWGSGRGSNYGQNTVDIFAPGTAIYSTMYSDSYGHKSGTSMAAPMVTGVAAMLKSLYPFLSTMAIKDIILDNVDVVSSLNGLCRTGGRLNAAKAVQVNNKFAGGDGTQSYPYQISTMQQLRYIPLLDSDISTVYFELTEDINVNWADWTPLNSFYGELDGNDKIISNMCIWSDDPSLQKYGLFEENYGYIKNLTVENGSVGLPYSYSGTIYAGTIAGINYGTILNCTNSYASGYRKNNKINRSFIIGHKSIEDRTAYAGDGFRTKNCDNAYIGGIAGANMGIIEDCENYVYIGIFYHDEDSFVGGIAGGNYDTGTIINCVNDGEISGVANMGGIAGSTDGVITGCGNNGFLGYVGLGTAEIGGIAGRQTGGIITNSVNNGTVAFTYWRQYPPFFTPQTAVQPCMAQIIGSRYGGTSGSPPNTWPYGTVDPGAMSGNQLSYVKVNQEIGL